MLKIFTKSAAAKAESFFSFSFLFFSIYFFFTFSSACIERERERGEKESEGEGCCMLLIWLSDRVESGFGCRSVSRDQQSQMNQSRVMSPIKTPPSPRPPSHDHHHCHHQVPSQRPGVALPYPRPGLLLMGMCQRRRGPSLPGIDGAQMCRSALCLNYGH